MLPVVTMSSERGVPLSRWLSRKSRSLVTTTRWSLSARLAISESGVRLPDGNVDT